LVARFVRDEEVAGSNPVTPTKRRHVISHAVVFMKFALRASEIMLRIMKYTGRMKCAAAHGGNFISGAMRYFMYKVHLWRSYFIVFIVSRLSIKREKAIKHNASSMISIKGADGDGGTENID
jgi:hypothetical protein